MPVQNVEIAAALNKLADLLEIEGENPYRVRAYRNAARNLHSFSHSVADMVARGEDLRKLPGIGEALSAKLAEIVQTGHLTALEKEERKLPAALSDLMKIPGLGPKRVHVIFERLKISDRTELGRAAKDGRIAGLPGFGEKTAAKIMEFLASKEALQTRVPLAIAEQLVRPILEALRAVEGMDRVTPAGSYRRRAETVGDVDILATCATRDAAMDRFVKHEDVREVLARGETKSSVILRSGLQVDLRVVDEESYGAALHYFTGSKAHNIAVRTRGVKAGLKINEYGVYRGEKRLSGRIEEDVFQSVGLPFIPPELREDRGEIEAAEAGRLPSLIEVGAIRGDLQSHTTTTDGHASLIAMAKAAQARGYEYLAVTDHSQRMTVAHGMNATRLRQQMRQIDRLNEAFKGFRLLKSVEVDILEDGALDLPDDVLAELDVVICAVHSRFTLSRENQTERIIRAFDNPHVHILAHPTGRLIGERAEFTVDIERLLDAARERGCFLEVNAQPSRLDLNDVACKLARERGVKLAVSTDAHDVDQLALMPYGINQARRGWLEAADVLNTRPWPELRKLIARA